MGADLMWTRHAWTGRVGRGAWGRVGHGASRQWSWWPMVVIVEDVVAWAWVWAWVWA